VPDASSAAARAALLARSIDDAGADVAPAAREALAAWLDAIVEWNARIDLTAARGDAELVDLMVADALVLARHLPPGARFVDVGSASPSSAARSARCPAASASPP
jgi:16S rRNA G527 N7-methylase RsmG